MPSGGGEGPLVPGAGPHGSADDLEALRAASGLSIDDEGRFLHRGEPITHARTLEVLWASLFRAPDGRWRVAIGREQGDVAVDETPWVVRAVEPDATGAAPGIRLAGGRRERLDPAGLGLGPDGVLRCRLAGGDLARFSRAAQVALGLTLEEDPPGSGHYWLPAGGSRWPVGTPPP
jgi:hypothetical protein